MKNMSLLNKCNLAFFTGSRSEFDIFFPLMQDLLNEKLLKTNLYVSGSHFKNKFGNTSKYVINKTKKLKFHQNHYLKIDISNDLSFIFGNLVRKIGKLFKNHKIKILIVVGDRYETLAVSLAAYLHDIPIIHFHGGETTRNMKDENFRYCISKISNHHFVSTKLSKKNLNKIGIYKNINVVGSLSLENINSQNIDKTNYFENSFILFTFHPLSDQKENKTEATEVFKSLKILSKKYSILITSPNQDPGNEEIFRRIKSLIKIKNNKIIFVKSLGSLKYFNAVNNCHFVMGNTSSGIIEVASFNKFFLNIGSRQEGREISKNTISVSANCDEIIKGVLKIEKKINKNIKFTNVYYRKDALIRIKERILKIIKE